ncbi:hypothetical protein quinque_013690 [Culex quinquefasciatus]
MDSAFNSQEPTNSFGVVVAAAIFLWNANNLFLWGVVPELIYWISRLATRGHFIEHLQHVVRQKRIQPDVVSSQSRRNNHLQTIEVVALAEFPFRTSAPPPSRADSVSFG